MSASGFLWFASLGGKSSAMASQYRHSGAGRNPVSNSKFNAIAFHTLSLLDSGLRRNDGEVLWNLAGRMLL
ncbi:hypothetical protein [Dyella psychrodurans]|uniref:Uncharacterized protein n=1 Tax=Dyella psychrodurans TaxID=1927960 RepID=A0A370WVU2_9GAMM|nr:hypothetical protein [Dyella psychrodurans]RDS80075.1 hypothetical protein DWU99_20135 [Dyella psychrodurans]